jgi:hypothetical protein
MSQLKIYDLATHTWKYVSSPSQMVAVSDAPPATPYNGMLWWDTDDASLLVDTVAPVTLANDPAFTTKYAPITVNGTYVPVLANLAIGTGGTPINTATFTFNGLSAGGVLTVEGVIKFGTTSITLPGASAPTISLPVGYSLIAPLNTEQLISSANFFDVSAALNYRGVCMTVDATHIAPQYLLASAPGVAGGPPVSTVPFTWATADEIHWRILARCTGP